MNFLERYKILPGDKGWHDWVNRNGMNVGYDYPCIGFSKLTGTLPPLIHLIVRDKIVTTGYASDRFELMKDNV